MCASECRRYNTTSDRLLRDDLRWYDAGSNYIYIKTLCTQEKGTWKHGRVSQCDIIDGGFFSVRTDGQLYEIGIGKKTRVEHKTYKI